MGKEVKTKFVEQFKFEAGLKKVFMGMAGAGFVLLLAGIVIGGLTGEDHGHGGHGDGHGGEHHEDGAHGEEHSSLLTDDAIYQFASEQQGNEEVLPENDVPEDAPQDETDSEEAIVEEEGTAPVVEGGEAENPNMTDEDHPGEHYEDIHRSEKELAGGEPPLHDESGHEGHHHGYEPDLLKRVLVNININAFFFMGLGLLGLFFIAVNYTANAGWYVLIKRIPEAFTRFIPIGWAILMVILFAEMAGLTHIHPWTDSEWMASDPLLGEKDWYLNTGFFIGRQLFIIVLWVLCDNLMRRYSTAEDSLGGIELFKKQRRLSALFLIVFAFSFSMASWDWMQALDPHFFSTMYAVHTFASVFVSALCLLAVVMTILKQMGYAPQLNAAHFHDVGKFVFGFSIFWTYIWFSEFLLIWYANIPEEGMYFFRIMDNYPFLFTLNLVVNFLLPLLGLMTNTSKRIPMVLGPIAAVVFVGHWIDFYLLSMPSVLGPYGSVGLVEIGTYLLFLGVFLYLGFQALTKSSLVPKKHPYLQESIQHYY